MLKKKESFNNNNYYDTYILYISFFLECFWTESAPFRNITVRDALCDLPEIKNGSMCLEIPYNTDPMTHFQRKMRGPGDNTIVRDHICKEMSSLVVARMSHIPIYPGADWRDLPNIKLRLTDGTITNILQYAYTYGYTFKLNLKNLIMNHQKI